MKNELVIQSREEKVLRRLITISLLILFFLFTGCDTDSHTGRKVKEVIQLDQLDPLPVHQENLDSNVLKVAIAAILSPQGTIQSYQPFLRYLENKVGKDVILIQKKTYQEVNDLLHRNVVDVAFVCTGAYKKDRKSMELLVVPQINGKTTYRSLVIVPSSSKTQYFAELQGRVFAFTDPMSNSGYSYPLSLLEKRGQQPETFFSRTFFTYSHDRSIAAVAGGLADGASVDSLVFEFFKKRTPEITDQIRVIHRSEEFGIPPVVVPETLPEAKREWLKKILLEAHSDQKGQQALEIMGVDRFVEADAGLYD